MFSDFSIGAKGSEFKGIDSPFRQRLNRYLYWSLSFRTLGAFFVDISSVDLDGLGLLKATQLPKHYDWLTDLDKQFLLRLYMAGPEGLTRREAEKEEKINPEVLLRLDAASLTTWERDNRGRLAFYCLTSARGMDVGELLMQIAKNKSKYAKAA